MNQTYYCSINVPLFFIWLAVLFVGEQLAWASDWLPPHRGRGRFGTTLQQTKPLGNGLHLASDAALLSLSVPFQEHIALRNRVGQLNGPWVPWEQALPKRTGQIYYRGMTLDVASLKNVLKVGMEHSRNRFDGLYVSDTPGFKYCIGGSPGRCMYTGKITGKPFERDSLVLATMFKLNAARLPMDARQRAGKLCQMRLNNDIPVEAIEAVYAYNIRDNSLHLIATRQPHR